MLVFLCAFAAVVTAAGAYLLAVELRRFRADHNPAPPLPPEESARDVWNALVADVIAALSIVAVLIAWQSAVTFNHASDLSNVALQQTGQYQAVKAAQDSRIEFGDRLTQLYQEHTVAENSLYTQAADARRAGDAPHALELEAEARLEGAEARAIEHAFLGYAPDSGANGAQSFDRQVQQAIERATHTDLRTLDGAHVAEITVHATGERTRGEELILSSALLIAATLFLTIARLGWKHRRLLAAVPGEVCAVAGLGLLILATVTAG